MAQESPPTGNAFLDGLLSTSLARLLPLLERVRVQRDQVIDESAYPMKYADFPVTALLSLIGHSENGSTLELDMIGTEDMKGLPKLLSAIWIPAAPVQFVVQESGEVLRLKASSFQAAVEQDRELHRAVCLFYAGRLAEANLIAFCNRFHSVDQQLSRWLLCRLSHTRKPEFDITHERIAALLGVRRQAVQLAARKLQRAGTLSYRHGHVRVLNPSGLEASSCGCHETIVSIRKSLDDDMLKDRHLALPAAGTKPIRGAAGASKTSWNVTAESSGERDSR